MVNLPIGYPDKQVTPFGGMGLMKRFIDRTGIRDFMRGLGSAPSTIKPGLWSLAYHRVILVGYMDRGEQVHTLWLASL